MDASSVLEKIKESGIAGEQFWYIYAIVVTGLLVLLITAIIILVKGFLTRFLSDIKDTHKQFADSITKLTESNTYLSEMVKLHDYQIKHLDDDIKDISKRRRQ